MAARIVSCKSIRIFSTNMIQKWKETFHMYFSLIKLFLVLWSNMSKPCYPEMLQKKNSYLTFFDAKSMQQCVKLKVAHYFLKWHHFIFRIKKCCFYWTWTLTAIKWTKGLFIDHLKDFKEIFLTKKNLCKIVALRWNKIKVSTNLQLVAFPSSATLQAL